jgi:hypothetical protein
MHKTARAFARARFASLIPAVRSRASFHLMRRTEDCDIEYPVSQSGKDRAACDAGLARQSAFADVFLRQRLGAWDSRCKAKGFS